jgi:hypothetical protein
MGAVQLVRRRSLLKVDPDILLAGALFKLYHCAVNASDAGRASRMEG